METYNTTESYYRGMLDNVREQIIEQIRWCIQLLGGRVCVRHYHEFSDMERNTYFEVDDDGHGRELFLDTIITKPSGEIEIMLHDSEDGYQPWWDLSYLTATDSLYVLSELEDIITLVEEEGAPIIKDYNPDYEEE